MNKPQLLKELYSNAFAGNIDKVVRITDQLCRLGVSYRIQNQVLQLADTSCRIECVVTTIKGLIEENESFNLPALN